MKLSPEDIIERSFSSINAKYPRTRYTWKIAQCALSGDKKRLKKLIHDLNRKQKKSKALMNKLYKMKDSIIKETLRSQRVRAVNCLKSRKPNQKKRGPKRA